MNIKAEGDRYKNNSLLEWIVEELITSVTSGTRHRIVGDLGSKQRPLVTLHGGPDDNHEYPLVLTALVSTHGIPVIFYDQIGSGPSTHLPVKKGDGSIWTEQLFCDELNYLDRHLAENTLRNGLPKNVQDTLMRHEGCGSIFYILHVCRVETWPHGLNATFRSLEKDTTVYKTMHGFKSTIYYRNGPNEFHVIATWSIIDQLHNIQHCTTIFKNIPKYKWVQFANSSYTPQWEDNTFLA
ncbi:proline iminopeptidase [Hysterangium stoloniferum]|nr:proline iminopeptidase [Hysterangium stoloniferum]